MKKVIVMLFVVIIAFSSCETTETNSPAFQVTVDSLFFKAADTRISLPEEGGLLIQGLSNDETVSIQINNMELGEYVFDVDNGNSATWEDFDGNVYTTNPEGSGSVTLTAKGDSNEWYSGNFNYTAINAVLMDTVVLSRGIFFESPLVGVVEEEPTGDSDTFNAEVNGTTFTPITITGVETANAITVAGATATATILLRMPPDVAVGNYSLPSQGFTVSYTENGVTENATNGNVSIISHDLTANTISGTFTFETAGNSITSGQFSIDY